MSSPFTLYNGHFFKHDEKIFDTRELSQLLFTESFRTIRNQLMFWDEHLSLISLQFRLLNLSHPSFLKNDAKDLKRQIERTLVKNKLFKSARINIRFFLTNNLVTYLIESTEIETTRYEFNTEGLTLALFKKVTKTVSPLSSLRLASEIYWKIAQQASTQPSVEMILQNTEGSILEVPHKNIYILKGNSIYTPAPEIGAYINPAKRIIQQICAKSGFDFIEDKQLTEEDLFTADEVFLADDIHGVNWVKAFEMKRYFNKTTKKINEDFNSELIQ